jgi:hypothetical protein
MHAAVHNTFNLQRHLISRNGETPSQQHGIRLRTHPPRPTLVTVTKPCRRTLSSKFRRSFKRLSLKCRLWTRSLPMFNI